MGGRRSPHRRTAAVEAGCDTGSAPVTITDTTITFGPLVLTRMACPEPQTTLENTVVAVLDGEVTYTIDGDTLQLRKAADAGEIGLNLTATGSTRSADEGELRGTRR